MAYPKVLALLLCENATRGPDEKVTLHGLFDRIIVPRTPSSPKLFFVYYKIVVDEPCKVALRIVDASRSNSEVPGNWCDSITEIGPAQSVWALTTALLRHPGQYVLELRKEADGSEALTLATTLLSVEQEGL